MEVPAGLASPPAAAAPPAAARLAWTVAAAIGWLAFAVIGIAKGVTLKTFDFAVFHTAGARFLEGSALYRAADGDMPFKYPPFIAPAFAAFGALPRPLSGALWNLAALVTLAWVVRIGLDRFRANGAPFAWRPQAAVWAGAILVHALFFELSRGQADLFVLGAVTAAVLLAKRHPIFAGLFAVMAAALKLPALLLLLYFLRFRHGRVLAAMIGVVAALEAIVFVRYGVDGAIALHQTWREVLVGTTPDRVMTTQGWTTLVLGITGLDPAAGMFAVQAAGSALLAAILWWRRAGEETWFAVLALAIAGLSPLCWNPNYVLAWPALVLAFHHARSAGASVRERRAVIAIGIAAAVLLTVLTPGILSMDRYQHLLGLLRPYAWLSLLLAAYLIVRARRQTAQAAPAA